MRTGSFALLTTLLLLTSCNNSDDGNSDLPYDVNIERDIDNISSMPLSYLGSKLEYVLLDTDSACLIKTISSVSISDSFLFVSDYYRLLLFNKSGKFIRQIGSNGRGPGEYSRVLDFVVDEKSREIYILSSRQVLVFDFIGQFKRDFKLGFPSNQFVLNESNELVLHSFNTAQATDEPVYSWYILKKNGKDRAKIPNELKRVNGGIIIPTSPLYMYNNTLHFMEFGIDTLYSYENFVKKPHVIFYAGNLKFPPDPTINEVPSINGKIWVEDVLETKKSLFIKISWWRDLSASISKCVFDKSTSKFTILKDEGFKNDIDGGISFWPEKVIDDDMMIGYVDAFNLIKLYKDNKLVENKTQSSQLEDVMKNLNETSNPVIIILYPK